MNSNMQNLLFKALTKNKNEESSESEVELKLDDENVEDVKAPTVFTGFKNAMLSKLLLMKK